MAVTLPYEDMEFVPLDILTAQEQNQLVANIEYLAGLFPLGSSEIADGAVTSSKLAFTTLYSNSTGSTNFTLSNSVRNFVYVLIFYKTNDGFVSSKLVEGGQNFVTDLSGWQVNNASPGNNILKASIFSFSGTSVGYLADIRHIETNITGTPSVVSSPANNVLITKVVGIK